MRQKLGQHFLANPRVSAAAAAALHPQAGDTVIEIGPGHGELTQAIFSAYDRAGGTCALTVIERDPALAAEVRRRFADRRLTVVEGDALQEVGALIERLGGGPYKIAGNIPYYITGHLLRELAEVGNKPKISVFLVQREVAERVIATPPHMNRLAAAVQYWANPRIVRAVKSTDFRPSPEVDSAVIALESNDREDSMEAQRSFFRALHMIFAQPRKTVFNNLREGLKESGGIKAAQLATEMLRATAIDANARPQDLTIAHIAHLARLIENPA